MNRPKICLWLSVFITVFTMICFTAVKFDRHDLATGATICAVACLVAQLLVAFGKEKL